MPGEVAAVARVDREFLTRTAVDLVRIPSVNPALGSAGAGLMGESRVADYVGGVLKSLGLEVERLERVPGRPSVVGILRGGGGPSLMLNAHYDTVGVDGMEDPFGGRIRDGRLLGRGAYDMKGALASCLAAMKALVESGASPPGDVYLAAVSDEETESLGVREVLERHRPECAVVTEPSELGVCTAHKGFVWVDLLVQGIAVHGSRPDLGRDANLDMARLLARVADHRDELASRGPHPLLGVPSIHCGIVSGGEGPSTYAAECRATLERRTLPGERIDEVRQELESVLDGRGAPRLTLARPGFEAPAGSPVVRALSEVVRATLGGSAPPVGTGPWTDAAFFAEAGVDTVVFGPRGGGAHGADEWVDLDSLAALGNVLVRMPAQLEADRLSR